MTNPTGKIPKATHYIRLMGDIAISAMKTTTHKFEGIRSNLEGAEILVIDGSDGQRYILSIRPAKDGE